MSLSYRKARTAPTQPGSGTDQPFSGNARTASGQLPSAVGAGTAPRSGAGTAAPDRSGGGGPKSGDNVVELFPGVTDQSGNGRLGRLRNAEAGMATAEYAIATLAAVGFAGLLVVILRSDAVRGFLMTIIEQALTLG